MHTPLFVVALGGKGGRRKFKGKGKGRGAGSGILDHFDRRV